MRLLLTLFENMLVALLSIVIILVSLYLLLYLVDWWMRRKGQGREQDGLSRILSSVKLDPLSAAKMGQFNKVDKSDTTKNKEMPNSKMAEKKTGQNK
ncbi:MAG: hypothetical protein GY874_19895 [Desulfobacteraceae bacterium]|nr:hypothetical protein [Desulfobacteraceae bacterium]